MNTLKLCTGKQIPVSGSSGHMITDEIFNEAIAHVEYVSAFQALYNNSEYSKLAIGNTGKDYKQYLYF